ncbi:MAG: endonuclease/exonuclease/phosphatase family protein [Acidimicrobiia bacterium]|nr:endonuclease/exonuclease/phosphatase family protein [Acidimicrobiia bacterium]
MVRSARQGALALTAALCLLVAACGSDDTGDEGEGAVPAETTTTAAERSGESDDATSGEFLLLSYNVAGLPQEISDENPEVNIPLISPLLEPYDIVLTQEDFDWWQPQLDALDFVNYHERLRADTTHPYRTERNPGPEAAGLDWEVDRPDLLVGDGLGILSRIPFTDVERVPWNDCFGGAATSDGGAADCLAMKGFAVATFTLADGAEIDIYTLHAEAGSVEESLRIREENYQQLATFMAERSDGRAVIIAGDMNLHGEPDHRRVDVDIPVWERFLEATGLTYVCDVVTCELPGQIDKAAFRSGGGVEIEVLSQRFATDDFVDGDGEDLSDHPPLEVRFAWRGAD